MRIRIFQFVLILILSGAAFGWGKAEAQGQPLYMDVAGMVSLSPLCSVLGVVGGKEADSFYYDHKPQFLLIIMAIFCLLVLNVILFINITRRKRAETALLLAHDELEGHVEERTAELAKANEELRKEITERQAVEGTLLEHQKLLRKLTSELSLAEERMRHQIAIDIHDHIGQNLAISKIKLASLSEEPSLQECSHKIKEVCELISETILSTRSLTFELSPPVLYELGFEAALDWLVRQVRTKHNLSIEFESDGKSKLLSDDARIFLFQSVRELLVNIVKHAQARNIVVSARKVDNKISVHVKDDGVGFDVSETSNNDYHFGLFSIRERLEHIGGCVQIESARGLGTDVSLVAPLKKDGTEKG